ncbi:tRNA (N6-threonylcarbamoyladenosine(37)-N6)-methyltransferase TrmO [Methanoculleus bourgensis]|uniref:TsaA-like domain-containing protein n=1 Tax=Methanoculleus bourgensis TaxID=83986 RepID=A0A0X3BQC3_9EURY|nr:tRNA (N6-threonylcarbamoyladenosine(37)-N6)-methyltransferase TrmO [Methanoculleus bourgensis]CVK34129.1 protein of unknown function [Methanoculleus bourgensis]
MPVQGVEAEIEVFPDYAGALSGVEENSHLILICWLHEADRAVLKAVARKVSRDLPEKGVFSLRSPERPNPLSVSVVRLRGLREGRFLELENVDVIDGTPVVDIKPYQTGWDCVFSATGHDRTEKIEKMGPGEYREGLIREAVNYHGELCPGVAAAVRVAEAATRILRRDLRHPQSRSRSAPTPASLTRSSGSPVRARETTGWDVRGQTATSLPVPEKRWSFTFGPCRRVSMRSLRATKQCSSTARSADKKAIAF